MQRSAMRVLAFQMIYGMEMQKQLDTDFLEMYFEANDIIEEEVQDYLSEIKEGLEKNKQEIEELIVHNLKENWSLDRVSKVNLSLIKLSIFEMLYLDLPYKIAINEVVELAKKYSDDQAPSFVNGVLASVVKEKGLNKNEK